MVFRQVEIAFLPSHLDAARNRGGEPVGRAVVVCPENQTEAVRKPERQLVVTVDDFAFFVQRRGNDRVDRFPFGVKQARILSQHLAFFNRQRDSRPVKHDIVFVLKAPLNAFIQIDADL